MGDLETDDKMILLNMKIRYLRERGISYAEPQQEIPNFLPADESTRLLFEQLSARISSQEGDIKGLKVHQTQKDLGN